MKWIKLNIKFNRKNEKGVDTHTQLLQINKIDFESVENAIKNYISEWTGEGSINIVSIETGPYIDDVLTIDQIEHLKKKEYLFDN